MFFCLFFLHLFSCIAVFMSMAHVYICTCVDAGVSAAARASGRSTRQHLPRHLRRHGDVRHQCQCLQVSKKLQAEQRHPSRHHGEGRRHCAGEQEGNTWDFYSIEHLSLKTVGAWDVNLCNPCWGWVCTFRRRCSSAALRSYPREEAAPFFLFFQIMNFSPPRQTRPVSSCCFVPSSCS